MKLSEEVAQKIKHGQVGVIPTDTLYGLVGSSLDPQAVEKIYQLKKRDIRKPLIVLISDQQDLKLLNIKLSDKMIKFFNQIWPNPVSVILECKDTKFDYLTRGTKSIAFRIPKSESLQNFIKLSGPIVAPSANLEGKPPASTIEEARKYFGKNADFYIDGGKLISEPSTLISVKDDKIKVLRPGAFEMNKFLQSNK